VQEVPTTEQPLLVGDTSSWLRPGAETLKDRSFQRGKGEAEVAGQSYSTLAYESVEEIALEQLTLPFFGAICDRLSLLA
jgi:hypothetical protein